MDIEFYTLEQARNLPLNLPDVYYSPSYAESSQIIDSGTWECAVADGGDIVYPYIRRRVPSSREEFDIVSPYGYSGVVSPTAKQRERFIAAFREKSIDRGLIAEFIRTNPFDVDDPSSSGMKVDSWRAHPTFAVDLKDGLDQYWSEAEGRHRTAVRKSQREGVSITQRPAKLLLDRNESFRRLYDETMVRVGSSSRLKLETEYYASLTTNLEDDLTLLEADIEGEVVAGALFIQWGNRLHYHLSGSSQRGMRVGATNALLDYAIAHVAGPGSIVHLGGGVHVNDGLEKFKRSIANRQLTVFLCQTVINAPRYRELVRATDTTQETSYFPAYRA